MDVSILTGPVHSDRARQVDDRFVADWGKALLVLPSRAQAQRRAGQLLRQHRLAGTWGKPVLEITDFAEQLLLREGIVPRRLHGYEQRLLMESCLDGAGEQGGELAQRPGLVNHLLRVVMSLKQAAVEPEDFARALGEQATDTDRIVAEAYSAYQQEMKRAAWYDVPGLYWEATDIARGHAPRLLAGIEHLLFDGFDDFTPSEVRLLEALSPHVGRLTLGINLDDRAHRGDLYALPRRTAEQLRQLFSTTPTACRQEEPRGFAAFAADHLFWRDQPSLPDDLREDLRLIPCGDERHEIETVLREAKLLVVDQGVAPTDIAIVVPNLVRFGDLIGDVAKAFGLPLQSAHVTPLGATRVGVLVRRFMEAGQEWARDPVLEMLLSPVLAETGSAPGSPGPPLDVLSRKAHIIRGQVEWVHQLTRLKEHEQRKAEDSPERAARYPDVVDCIDTALARIATLAEAYERFPASGAMPAFAAALEEVLDTWNWDAFAESLPDDAARQAESSALAALRRTLADIATWEHMSHGRRRSEGIQGLLQVLQECSVPGPRTRGGVHVLTPDGIRNLAFDHVFFICLNEGVLPAPAPLNAVYGERDIARLREFGLGVEGRDAHSDRQRLVFHHVLCASQASLTLTWHVLSDGREALPSPFVVEIADLFKGHGVSSAAPLADSFLSKPGCAVSEKEWHNHGARTPSLRKSTPDAFAPLETALAIEQDRFGQDGFGTYDGVLDDAAVRALLGESFDKDHLFSVNQVETYRNCPFHFFVQRVMDLEEAEAPEAEFDPRVRGTILHDALQGFHEHYLGVPLADIPLEAAMPVMREKLDAAFEGEAWKSVSAPEGVLRAERAFLETVLQRYLLLERGREGAEAWQPRHFEVQFGPDHRGATGSHPEPFTLETAAGPARFTGRIDRVDTATTEEKALRLVDYKTSTAPAAGDIDKGYDVQLVLYALAVEQGLFPGTQCEEALYLPIGKGKPVEALSRNPGRGKPKWPDRQAAALRGVAEALWGIRAGWFPPDRHGNSCYGCGQARACRYNQRRVERKHGASTPPKGDPS